MSITPKTTEEIAIMREGGHMLAQVCKDVAAQIAPGVSGAELDALAEERTLAYGAQTAYKGYDAGVGSLFPGTICFSVNEELVHGVPRADKVLQEGDIVSVDFGLIHKGYYMDMARTFAVGTVGKELQQLIDVAEAAFYEGVSHICDGAELNDYTHAVEGYINEFGYSIVRDLVGHGVGRALHEPPQIPNYYESRMESFTFRTGMTVAIEPMIALGKKKIKTAADGWTIIMADKKHCAHYENTLLVTNDGVEILTATE